MAASRTANNTAAARPEATRPENKCGVAFLPPARAMMSRSYFRHSALQSNFVYDVPSHCRNGSRCLFSRPVCLFSGWHDKESDAVELNPTIRLKWKTRTVTAFSFSHPPTPGGKERGGL